MTSLFTDIAKIVPTLEGWCSVPKALHLASIVCAIRPETVVEIGVFGGRSFIPMAMAVKAMGKGKVIGIDPWDSKASAEGMTGDNLKFWGTQCNHQAVFVKFAQELNRLELGGVSEIIRKRSDDVDPQDRIDLLHSDGNHSMQALRDVNGFAPRIRVGGFCVLDDLHWEGGGVLASEKALFDMGFIRLYAVKDTGSEWAVYQRVKA